MRLIVVTPLLLIVPLIAVLALNAEDSPEESQPFVMTPPATIAEARSRAILLHELIRGTLQVVHRDFFDEENVHAIPSGSLEDVFAELEKSFDIKVRWLNVNTDVVNVDHQPQDQFEKQAVKALARGKLHFEATENDRYRFAGPIRLASQCLKCHVKLRTTTEDRTAGLLISMPFKQLDALETAR